jgi:hypothetical protein
LAFWPHGEAREEEASRKRRDEREEEREKRGGERDERGTESGHVHDTSKLQAYRHHPDGLLACQLAASTTV